MKAKISYQSKLFIWVAALLCMVLISATFLVASRERAFRSETIRARVDLMNARVIDLYNLGQDPTSYMNFIDRYFDKSMLDNMSMNLYDKESGELIFGIGFPAPPPEKMELEEGALTGDYISANNENSLYYFRPDQAFYYTTKTSPDNRVVIQTIIPNDVNIDKAVSRGAAWWWAFVIISCVIALIVTYLTTRHLTRNIKSLRNFAKSAASDQEFVTIDNFANDELGEISREIVKIYSTRKAALASRELEHRVALKATEDRNQMRRQITNNINHELKTPASIIRGYIDTIMDNPDMDEGSRQHFLSKIQQQIERLCNILNDLSTMTRLEEASSKVLIEEIDFKKFVESLAVDIEESNLIGDMTFNFDIPDGCIVRANATLLHGAMMNLVKNAAAYSEGTEMGINLYTQNRRFYTFTFYDNGRGVPEEHIPLLFERFYRVDKGRSRKTGGTGLGLAIVRSSLNTMGGTISVKNREGGGLLFIFTLRKPLREGNPDAEE